jgi:hypothetical protein
MKKLMTLWKKARKERGSALLISLMVIVGLSMLGLGFVALSETESAISVNQRNREEALTHAEAAANVVVDWFQNPKWALSKGLMPSNDLTINTELNAMKLTRSSTAGVGKYKPSPIALLFDLPFKPGFDDRFWGTPASPDILISRTSAPKFLANFNSLLFTDTLEGGEITEIRIWAPPVVGGSTTNGYYNEGGDRFGVATVKVTAQRFGTADTTKSNPLATRTVQLVVTEFPFPGPNGPIQSNSAIFTQGSFSVYWGEVSSTKPLSLVGKETAPGMPWASAWDLAEFEHGYDSTLSWKTGTTYAIGDVVHASPAAIAADSKLLDWAFQVTAAGTTDVLAASEPHWDGNGTGTPVTTYDDNGTLKWKRVAPKNWPLYKQDATLKTDYYNWLYQMIDQTYIDPWAQARTRSWFTDDDPTKVVNPKESYPGLPAPAGLYIDPSVDPTDASKQPFYSWFQYQTKDQTPYYKIVAFPHIDYDFWKQMALAGDGQGSVFYFAYKDAKSGAGFYRLTDASVVKDPDDWANSCTGVTGALGPGFYFFDTIGGKNPQNSPNAATMLTPEVKVNNGSPCICMKGFIYLNTTTFSSKGAKGEEDKFYAFPGEPYRDVGFHWVIDDKTDPNYLKFKTDSISGRIAAPVNPNHGKWDFQDLNGNNTFDLILTDVSNGGAVTVNKPDGKPLTHTWVPVEYYEGCTIPDPAKGIAGNCSEPHEPYLNMIYPSDTSITYAAKAPMISGNISSYNGSKVTIGWENPNSQTRLAKKATDSSMTQVTNCSTDSANCTSNGHDDTGPLSKLEQFGPILEGVLYVEGEYNSEGNATYYGSVLVQGNCCGAGTPSVYFDESLVTGDFKSKFPTFPRVYISSYTTENQ